MAWLLDENVSVNHADCNGNTPLHIAIAKDQMDIGNMIHVTLASAIFKLTTNKQKKKNKLAKLLLEHGASTKDCLHTAAQYDRKIFVSLLGAMGANVNELNADGETPLQIAYKMVGLNCKQESVECKFIFVTL